jgi:hypothetical protein
MRLEVLKHTSPGINVALAARCVGDSARSQFDRGCSLRNRGQNFLGQCIGAMPTYPVTHQDIPYHCADPVSSRRVPLALRVSKLLLTVGLVVEPCANPSKLWREL